MIKENGDKPAAPVDGAARYSGLTKREMFAMAAMQGFLGADINWNKTSFVDVCHDAVKCADALLAELERAK